jgi:hypothetical protein
MNTLVHLIVAIGPIGVGHDEKAPTFTKDVAPILWKQCADCHHPGHVAPFPLLTYKDAAKRAGFIRDTTAARRMPPWKAMREFGDHVGARHLTDDELQTLARWADAGAPEGDPKDLPSLPSFPDEWQLGIPDLVLRMAEPYHVPAGGPDIYRCFIIPIPIDSDRDVAAVEFRPGNRKVVHHAAFFLDDKGLAKKRDREDGLQPGFTSIGAPGFPPSGSLGGWGLAALPRFLPEGTGMPIKKGSELVMQVHYHPTGKAETDQSMLGVYFTKKPAKKYVTDVWVRRDTFEIAPGEKRFYSVATSAPLPTAVQAIAVSPHMHNLGREVKVTAELPGGRVLPLVRITDWDFDWQELYHFKKPLEFPKGTVVKLEAWFDNSDDNPKNPNKPPKLVRQGNNLSDEMSACDLKVIVASRDDLQIVDAMQKSGPTMTRDKATPPAK